jgi:type I restriction enzyme S subunit
MFGDSEGWPSRSLSSIAVDGKGTFSNGPFGSDLLTSELTDTGVPVIYIRDIRDARYERVSTVYVTEEKAQALSACLVQPGDILVAKVGDPPGTTAIYSKGEPVGVMTQDVIRLRPNTEIVNAEFVASFLNSHIGCQLIRGITVEATRARFGLREFKMQEIPVPPMDLQIKFAAIVEKIDGLKFRYQQSLTDLETLYGALSQQAFKGELDLSRVPVPGIQT